MSANNLDPDDLRRRHLVRALAAGLFVAGTGSGLSTGASAQILGSVPGPLPQGRSIYKLKGDVRVNGMKADLSTRIGAADRVKAGRESRVVFAVGAHAYLLRADSEMQLEGEGVVARSLRLLTGALLSVFGRSTPSLVTTTATIGIRGTGVYMESEPDRSYVCTCYGRTQITSSTDPNATEAIVSEHHDAPRYILARGASNLIQPAPVKNHGDDELILLEALVGREPPFAVFGEGYGTSGRQGYD